MVNKMISDFLAEVQISYSTKVRAADRLKITGSADAANAFREIWPQVEHIEFSYILLLNRQNRVLGYHQVSKGGITGTVIDVRVIFQVALKASATAIIIAHNHPSGNLDVSDADKKITRQIKEAGKVLDIPLLDHLVITLESYYSMADEGIF